MTNICFKSDFPIVMLHVVCNPILAYVYFFGFLKFAKNNKIHN